MKHRTLLTDVYYLLETYEDSNRDPSYWVSLVDACNAICQRYPNNPLAAKLVAALYDALEELSNVRSL